MSMNIAPLDTPHTKVDYVVLPLSFNNYTSEDSTSYFMLTGFSYKSPAWPMAVYNQIDLDQKLNQLPIKSTRVYSASRYRIIQYIVFSV